MPKIGRKVLGNKTIKSALTKGEAIKKENQRIDYLNTGSIVLNLAASQKGRRGGWARGRIINLVGDNSSGKSLLSIEALANAYHTFKKHGDLESYVFPKVKELIMVYNNVEGVMDFPLEEMYGEDFVKSILWVSSKTCEEFGRDVQRRVDNLKPGQCLLYVADSLDAMVSSAQKDRTEKALKTDKDEDAAYGAEKAKYFSGAFFNNLCEKQQGKDATLFMVSQLRENIGGCFDYESRVLLADGETEKIGTLVSKKKKEKVLSFNTKTQKLEEKEIIGWHYNGKAEPNEFIKLKLSGGGSGLRVITTTKNHMILTDKGETQANNLSIGDNVLCIEQTHFTEDQHEIILGSLFGDGSLQWETKNGVKGLLKFGHCAAQSEYCKWKAEVLGGSFGIKKDGSSFGTSVRSIDFQYYKDFPKKKGKNTVRKDIQDKFINALTVKSVAIWFMDDGGKKVLERGTRGESKIYSKYLSFDTLTKIAAKIESLGLGKARINVGRGLSWSGEDNNKFQRGIEKYIHPNLRYKLFSEYVGNKFEFNVKTKQVENIVVPLPIIDIYKAKEIKRTRRKYDLTIEDNHNYIVCGVLVHNSMFSEKYKRVGGKALDFYSHQVCWLRVKDKLKKTFRGNERVYGVRDSAIFKKNKCAKPYREAEFSILFDFGLDNIGSMVDYLFGPKGKGVEWDGEKMSRDELVELIEGNKQEYNKLVALVEKDWNEIEEAVAPKRKNRWED